MRLMRTATQLLLAAALLSSASCGIGVQAEPQPIYGATLPSPFRVSSSLAPGVEPTTVYLVRDGILVPVVRRAAAQLTPIAVLDALLAGPTKAERARGLTTAVPLGATVARTDYTRELVVVALDATQAAPTRTDEVLGYAQLVATLTQLRQINNVAFERNHRAIAVPRADGSLKAGPLVRLDYARLL